MDNMNKVKVQTCVSVEFTQHVNIALSALWTNNSSAVRADLLKVTSSLGAGRTPVVADTDDDVKEALRRRLSLGAICVYQDCYNILQVFLRKRGAVAGEETSALEGVKGRLVAGINNKDITEVAKCIRKLSQLFLLIHAR